MFNTAWLLDRRGARMRSRMLSGTCAVGRSQPQFQCAGAPTEAGDYREIYKLREN